MKRWMPIAVLLILSLFACAKRTRPEVQEPVVPGSGSARLTVTIHGLKNDEGEVAVALFSSAESFKQRTNAVASGRLTPEGETANWSIEGLDPGTYAIAVYHDLNGNGELDRPTVGPPTEPYGFSNDARGTFGPPKFDKAAFELGAGEQSIEIGLR